MESWGNSMREAGHIYRGHTRLLGDTRAVCMKIRKNDTRVHLFCKGEHVLDVCRNIKKQMHVLPR